MLPGIDDGAKTLDVALAMARMAVADGIVTVACTPHILPGVYNNTAPRIAAAVTAFAAALAQARIPLEITTGADVHLAPNLLSEIQAEQIPTLGQSRYLLLEPPHHVLPPRLEEFAFSLSAQNIVPVLTHPERLAWIEARYDVIVRLAAAGVLMQVTAGSLLGKFGRPARYWAERMMDEGIVHLLASDGHDIIRRPPVLSEAREFVAGRWGEAAATALVVTNPLHILQDGRPSDILQPHPQSAAR
jgi:protein-tyrosine phosphatase